MVLSIDPTKTPAKEQIAIGRPLPFPVYDREGQLLLREGYVIESMRQFEALSESGVFRRNGSGDAMIPLVGVRRAERHGPSTSGAEPPPAPDAHDLSFESLALPVGSKLQLERIGHDERRYTTRLIGYVHGVSVLVETPLADGGIVMFREGESCIARAFSGTEAFAFTTIVVSVRYAPDAYLHLSYPKRVAGTSVRKQRRVDVRLIATVTHASATGSVTTPSRVVDLSAGGAQIESRIALGKTGDVIEIAFRLPAPSGEATFSLDAEIRSIHPADDAHMLHGIHFLDVQPLEALALVGYVARPASK